MFINKDLLGTNTLPAILNIENCDFYNNFTNNTLSGGSIFLKDDCRLVLSNSRFSYCKTNTESALNITQEGGFISFSDAGYSVISNCVFRGGDLAYTNSGSLTLTGKGGAINVYNTSIKVADSYFLDNRAKGGSAIYFSAGGNSVIQNCLFFGNTNDSYKGTINNNAGGSVVSIFNSTITGNSSNTSYSDDNAGVFLNSNSGSSAINIYNSIIWNNGRRDISGTSSINIFNSIIDSTGGGISTGTNVLLKDPLFVNASIDDYRIRLLHRQLTKVYPLLFPKILLALTEAVLTIWVHLNSVQIR